MEARVSEIGEWGLKPSLLHLDVNTKKPKSKFMKAPPTKGMRCMQV